MMAIIREDMTEAELHQHFFGKPESKPKRVVDFSQHQAMCRRAAAWLRSRGCAIAVSEMVAMANEKPDAIGWRSYQSHVVEVKMSRADFMRDKHKWHRKEDGRCMGDFRYYFCPPDVLKAEDMPPKWGLVYCDGRKCRVIVKAEQFDNANLETERAFLVSIARRLKDGCEYIGEKIGKHTTESKGDKP